MATIKCISIEKPDKQFLCDVLRPASELRYQDSTDGIWKPVQPERWEKWTVLAETKEGAKKIAQRNFHLTNDDNIIILD